MSDKTEAFARQIETARWRVASLQRHADESPYQAGSLLPSVFEELQVAFEELRAAEEEMLQQQQTLLDTHMQIEVEQERYRDLFEFAPDAYLVTMANGLIREANRAAVELLGGRSVKLTGLPLAMFVAEDARQAFRNDTRRLRQTKETRQWELRMQTQGGRLFDAALTVAPIHDWSGAMAGLRWMVRDISERKQAEEQLEQRVRERTAQLEAIAAEKEQALEQARQARAAAEQALRDRETFMAAVAYGLKAPLAAIISYSQLLQRRVMSGDTLKSRDLRGLRMIAESAQQLTSVGQLLEEVAQIEAGTLSIAHAPIDLAALVQKLPDMLRAILTRHTLRLHCGDQQILVQGDELRLQQVLLNLVQHAITHSPARATITVIAERVDGLARLTVDSPGNATPATAFQQAPEHAYQAGEAQQAAGVELYIAKQIVRLHNGRFEIQQAAASSSCVVWLPLAGAA